MHQTEGIPRMSQTIRVFVSSTFGTRTLSAMSKIGLCFWSCDAVPGPRGEFVGLDMRWGVTEDEVFAGAYVGFRSQ